MRCCQHLYSVALGNFNGFHNMGYGNYLLITSRLPLYKNFNFQPGLSCWWRFKTQLIFMQRGDRKKGKKYLSSVLPFRLDNFFTKRHHHQILYLIIFFNFFLLRFNKNLPFTFHFYLKQTTDQSHQSNIQRAGVNQPRWPFVDIHTRRKKIYKKVSVKFSNCVQIFLSESPPPLYQSFSGIICRLSSVSIMS